jgi:hypothetical protein
MSSKFHPNIIEGIGIEDLETLERVFSASNALASIIRFATAYQHRLFINMFFKQWDADKYLNLGNMLYENYQQALQIIGDESPLVEEAKVSLNIKDGELEVWQAEEAQYFSQLGKEPEWDIHAMAYVEMLQELRQLEYVS